LSIENKYGVAEHNNEEFKLDLEFKKKTMSFGVLLLTELQWFLYLTTR